MQRTNLWIDCIELLDGLQSIQYLSQSQDSPRNFARFCLCFLDVGVSGLGYMSFLQSYSVASKLRLFVVSNQSPNVHLSKRLFQRWCQKPLLRCSPCNSCVRSSPSSRSAVNGSAPSVRTVAAVGRSRIWRDQTTVGLYSP